jgi:sec-independent protein translocase protein TatB
MHPYAGGEIHNPALTTDNSILPTPTVEIIDKPKRAPRKKAAAVAEPALVEPAKAPRKRAAAKKDITVEAPTAVRAPRKRTPKAGGSTASDIVS